MCNAWNHPSGCTCGWGGDGHAGRTYGGGSYSSHYFGAYRPKPKAPSFSLFESYVNPNARCPVCDEPVFFYQSPDGGKVFFDELGPPWPKHPCTDNTPSARGSFQYRRHFGTSSVNFHDYGNNLDFEAVECLPEQYSWFRDGWWPFEARVTNYCTGWKKLEGQVLSTNEQLTLYIHTLDISGSEPMLIQPVGNTYRLTTIVFDSYQGFLGREYDCEVEPPDLQAWKSDDELYPLIKHFIEKNTWPMDTFTLNVKDKFGTKPYISLPANFYRDLRMLIEKGPNKISAEEYFQLRFYLSVLIKQFS